MKSQHQVVLSIGSNYGNRFENIESCLQLIHHQVATVVKVSKVYESPSWGFESDPFYNIAVVVHTYDSADIILNKVLAIESQMGRVRNENSGYQSRSIDIDIIAFDNEIINTAQLKVPHPLMQERIFVLKPMLDLNLEWIHPILNQTVAELLFATDDKSDCIAVKSIASPLQNIALEHFNYVAFEGNIGAGKTTLATKIAEDFNAKSVL